MRVSGHCCCCCAAAPGTGGARPPGTPTAACCGPSPPRCPLRSSCAEGEGQRVWHEVGGGLGTHGLCVPAWFLHKRLVAVSVFALSLVCAFVDLHDAHAGTVAVCLNRHCQSMSATVLRELQSNLADGISCRSTSEGAARGA